MISNRIKTIKPITKHLLILSFILLTTLLANLNLFKVPFLYDDFDFLFQWQKINNFSNIPNLLLGDLPLGHEGVYRPVRSLFYFLSLKLFDHNLFLYHIQELFIYSLLVILIYSITQKLFQSITLSSLTTLYFTLLPLHIDNIANLTASFDTIGVIFLFFSLYFYLYYINCSRINKKIFLFLSLSTTILSYLTYEITLILPLLLLLIKKFKNLKQKTPTIYLLSPLIYLSIRYIMNIPSRGSFISDLSIKAQNLIHTLTTSLPETMLPLKSQTLTPETTNSIFKFSTASINNSHPTPLAETIIILLSLLTLSIILKIAWNSFQKKQLLGFSLLWFYISLLPLIPIALQSSPIFPTGQPLYARYYIIATFGTSLILANSLLHLLKTKAKNQLTNFLKYFGLSFLILLPFLYITTNSKNLLFWHDPTTNLTNQIQKAPNSPEKLNDLAIIEAQNGNYPKSLKYLRQSLKLKPNYKIAQENLNMLCQILKKSPQTKNLCYQNIQLKK